MIARQTAAWIVTANADNATATATKAAPAGALAHHVTGISGSFDATVSGAQLTLKQGSTEIGRWYVFDAFALTFVNPLRVDPGDAVSLELAASGTAGTVGAVNLSGYTL